MLVFTAACRRFMLWLLQLLDEERKLFDAEMQRMQANLDDAYSERSELSRLLDDVQRKRHRLEEERVALQRQVEAFHLPSLGALDGLPPLLRTEYPVVARELPPERLRRLVHDFFLACTERLDGGTYPEVQAVLLGVLRTNFEDQAMAEVRLPCVSLSSIL